MEGVSLDTASTLAGSASALPKRSRKCTWGDVRRRFAPSLPSTALLLVWPNLLSNRLTISAGILKRLLAHYIQTTTSNGVIVDGGVYWLDRIAETGMQAYYKNSFPTQGMRVMVTGINIPVRIGKALVMPGDVVLADREGLWFIPPHKVQEVVESGETSKARDDWSLMMLGTGKYTSRQIYGPLAPDLQKQRDDYVFQKTGRRPTPPGR